MPAIDQIEKQLAYSVCPNLLFHRAMEFVDPSFGQSVVVESNAVRIRRQGCVRRVEVARKFIVGACPNYSKRNFIAQRVAGRASSGGFSGDPSCGKERDGA